MSVYVDDMQVSYGRMVMCHMLADTNAELVAMADRIGVARRWIQNAGTDREHFDICKSKRAKAVAAGAIEITKRELMHVMRSKRLPSSTPGVFLDELPLDAGRYDAEPAIDCGVLCVGEKEG